MRKKVGKGFKEYEINNNKIMCGIFALLNHASMLDDNLIKRAFNNGQSRGPEYSIMKKVSIDAVFGFHRLAINGINEGSHQPIQIGNITLIANGEIYNYQELYKTLDVKPTTDSDCEVIIHCYLRFGIEYTLQLLDGVFAFILLDNEPNNTKMYVARDPYGVRPLYTMFGEWYQLHGFASTMSMLQPLAYAGIKIEHFQPGSYSVYCLPQIISPQWKLEYTSRYSQMTFSTINNSYETYENILHNVRSLLTQAVYKRCSTSDRPIACLLSGGLDSSIITALVSKYHKENGLPPVETYSIGLEGSEDLKYAEIVANYLGTNHTSVVVSRMDFIQAIPEVIQNIESYDTTTVRASIGNYLVAKYIAQNSEAKVIFSGEGSDELAGGYLYMNEAPNAIEFDHECKRLLKDIYMFDVTRCDKSISSNGLEPRTPFLDRAFTQYYLSIPAHIRYKGGMDDFFSYFKMCEKYIIRAAFDPKFSNEIYLPEEVLWRTKEAFSDGVSSQKESTFEILQEYIKDMDGDFSQDYEHNAPLTAEQKYYRHLFETHLPNQGHIIPYFWMPRFVEANDPSARTLKIYNDHHLELCERSL